MSYKLLIVFVTAMLTVTAWAQSVVPIEAWTVDMSKPSAKSIYITRGESVDIRPSVTYNGAWNFPAGTTVEMNYKSTDMTNTYYTVAGSVYNATGGVLTVPWRVAQEASAKAYSFEIKASTGSVAAIRITGSIFLRDSLTTLASTTTPTALTLIDWQTVSNLNLSSAPWNSSSVDTTARAQATSNTARIVTIEGGTSNWNTAYAHTTESSNTVHGGFIRVAYDWATNAWARAGLAWDQATNALAIAQTAFGWGNHALAGYVTGTVVRAENDSVFTNWLGPVPPDPWSNPQFVDFGQRSPSGLWSLIFNAGVTLVSSAGDDFTVNDNLGAPLLGLSQTVGAQVYPEIYALGGLRAPNSSGTNAITPSGLIDIGPSLQKADAALQPASTNGWTVTSHDGLVPANRTITVNGQVGTLNSNVAFTVTGSTDAPAWVSATNTELAITITNDLERPQYLYATGAVSLAFAGLRPPQPFYLVVKGPDSITFPAGTHFVGGASWQTNQANHFIVWQYSTNLFVNPVTTSTEE